MPWLLMNDVITKTELDTVDNCFHLNEDWINCFKINLYNISEAIKYTFVITSRNLA